MYSGTTLRKSSGNIMGAHQKIDRVARRNIVSVLPAEIDFPKIKDILHFEGRNGPDGIKSKSPSRDEPWHYMDPTDHDDIQLLGLIEGHIANLSAALAAKDEVRAAFEAAWLAHAIVDGLTPAHHYPLEDKIEELWGKPKEERLTIKEKNFIKGETRRDTISKNWQYWGAKGVFTTHFMFEWGVTTAISSQNFAKVKPSSNHLVRVEKEGVSALFLEAVHDIHSLGMYEDFHKKGWTRKLARETRQQLIPRIIELVMLAWYYASIKAARKAKA